MSQIFNIQDNKIIIDTLVLTNTEGDVAHTGNLSIAGTLTVDQLIVNNPVEESTELANFNSWTVNDESELAGKGLTWTWGNGSTQLTYRDCGRIWTNGSFDVSATGAYRIDGTPVLTANELGPQITKSRLREVGPLKVLDVIGSATIGQFAFFNPNESRLGINTAQPNAALSVVDNDVETIIGAQGFSIANIGTFSNHDLAIVTDNTTRVTVKNNGEVVFGDDRTKNAVVTINGTLNVSSIVTDTRIDRYSSLEFKSTRDTSIYGQGLEWTGSGSIRKLIMMGGPDRLWTSESFDIGPDQAYYANGVPVLSRTTLGGSVTESSLKSVGVLDSLTVNGQVNLLEGVTSSKVNTASLELASSNNTIDITADRIGASNNLSISVANDETYYADTHEISIGNKNNTKRPVKLYGQVTVGVNNPDPDVDFTVKGNVSFANKKFVTGEAAPTTGSFNKGDICWNSNPTSDNYVGWICIISGDPGVWVPFGAIARQ